MNEINRRQFLTLSTASAVGLVTEPLSPRRAEAASFFAPLRQGKPDYTIRIATGLIETAPDRIVSTTTDNGGFPGPLLRFREGRKAVVDVYNDTDTPEQLHWHGQRVPVEVDGSAEEGTPYIPAHGMRRIEFI